MTHPVDLAYDAAGLRAGAGRLSSSADAAERAAAALGATALTPGMFGDTPAAATFHSALTTARNNQAHAAQTEQQRCTDLAHRCATGAGLGDNLTADSTDLAHRGTPQHQ